MSFILPEMYTSINHCWFPSVCHHGIQVSSYTLQTVQTHFASPQDIIPSSTSQLLEGEISLSLALHIFSYEQAAAQMNTVQQGSKAKQTEKHLSEIPVFTPIREKGNI